MWSVVVLVNLRQRITIEYDVFRPGKINPGWIIKFLTLQRYSASSFSKELQKVKSGTFGEPLSITLESALEAEV